MRVLAALSRPEVLAPLVRLWFVRLVEEFRGDVDAALRAWLDRWPMVPCVEIRDGTLRISRQHHSTWGIPFAHMHPTLLASCILALPEFKHARMTATRFAILTRYTWSADVDPERLASAAWRALLRQLPPDTHRLADKRAKERRRDK